MRPTKRQLRDLLANWGVDPSTPIHDVVYADIDKTAEGVWRIGEEYYLRVRADHAAQLRNIAFSRAVAEQGLGAAVPVPTRDGQDFVDGEDIAVLTLRVPGRVLEAADFFGGDGLGYAQMGGRAVAKLHRALRTIEEDVPCDDVDLYKAVSEWALPSLQKQNEQWGMGFADSFFAEYLEQFGAMYSRLPRQPIHRDLHPANMLFDEKCAISFLDFDISERNARIFDIGYFATGILCGAKNEEMRARWLDLGQAVFRSYDEEANLTGEEKSAVYHMICSIQMIFIAYFADADTPNGKRLARENRDMLRFIVDHRDRIENFF